MFRMIKAEWYKMTKSKGFKILCVIALLFGLLTAGFCTIIDEEMIKDATGNEISEEQLDALLGQTSDEVVVPGSLGFSTNGAEDIFDVKPLEAYHMAYGTGVMEILIAVLVGMMLAKEYSEGTIKNTLAYGKKRTEFYLAKFINISAGIAVIMAIMTATATIGLTFTKGWGQEFAVVQLGNMARTFIGAVIVFSAVSAVIMLISTLVKSNAATIGISVVLFIFIPTMIAYFYGMYDWFDRLYECSLFYNSSLVTAIKASGGDILKASIIGLITIIIALGAGMFVFKAQDIK